MATYYWVGGSGTWNNTNAANWSLTSGGAGGAGVPNSADTVNFNSASGTAAAITITSTAASLNTVINKSDMTLTLSGNVTLCPSAGTLTLTSGTLALSSYTLTVGGISTSSTSTRTINFGTGKIVLNTSATKTVWTSSTVTNLTVTGTAPLVECIGGGAAVTKTITTGTLSEGNSISFSFLETSGSVTYSLSTSRVKNLLVNGVQTITHTGLTIYGSYTLLNSNGNTTYTASTSAWTFAATSGSYTISGSTSTHDFPWTFNGIGGSWTLQSNIVTGSSRAWSLTNGTIDFANYTITGASISIGAGTPIVKNLNTALGITIATTTANLTLGTDCSTTGALTMTGGQFSLGTYALTVGTFSSSGAGTKVMDFGTSGKIVVSSSATATIITGTNTGLTVLGTNPLMECKGGGVGVTKTISTGVLTENNAISISLLETTGSVTYTISSGSVVKDLTLNGTQTLTNNTRTIYGNFTNLTTNGTTTINGGTNATTFASTSGTKTITSSGATIDFTFIFSGVGGTWALQDALTLGSTRYATLTNGTLNLNGYTLTAFGASIAAGTRNLTFNGGTFVVLGSGTTCWMNPSPTGFTTTQGSAPGTISMTSSTAKTFEGGGTTYYATLNQGGTGDLTITGNNTFNNITGTITSTNPAIINLTAGSTTTLLSSFTGAGSSLTNYLKLRSFTSGSIKPTSRATISGSAAQTNGWLRCEYIDFTPFVTDGTAPSYSWFIGGNSTLYNCSGALATNYANNLVVYVLHSGTTWTVPSNFNSSNNVVHLFGGGAAGQPSSGLNAGGGGGGGGYTQITNYSATPSSSITFSIGAGGTSNSTNTAQHGTNTVFGAYSAGGGSGASNTGGTGGVGLTANGGNGGSSTSNSLQTYSGSGGGGAGGPNGVGGNGGSVLTFTGYVNQNRGGTGGGGGSGGSNGGDAPASGTALGASGGNNYSGTGGGNSSSTGAYDGAFGGGGGGGYGLVAYVAGGAGGTGTDILNSIGSGGGGGGGGQSAGTPGIGGAGGLYGGGGAGGSKTGVGPATQVGGSGGNGGIIIVYYTSTAVAATGNMFLMF